MIVLLDLEWIHRKQDYLTQLSAVRVDGDWTELARLDRLVQPPWGCLYDASHMALGGYPAERFRGGVSEGACLRDLKAWLRPDDTIWVWGKSSRDLLNTRWAFYNPQQNCPPILAMANQTRAMTSRALPGAVSPYDLLARLRIDPPGPEHRAANDADALRMLCSALQMTVAGPAGHEKPAAVSVQEPSPRERVRRTIGKSQFNYIYLKNSQVFHRRDCAMCLRAGSVERILGSVYYDTAAAGRRPCKLCRPVPAPPADPGTDAREAACQREEVVRVRMITGERIEIKRENIVGWCHCMLHPGALNKALCRRHRCVEKECCHLERNGLSSYWQARAEEDREKAKRKAQIRAEKTRRDREASELQTLAAAWQEYADYLDDDLYIVRVQKEDEYRYRVFYVSDNSCADSRRYKLFVETVQYFHPGCRVTLRHIRDVDGHFVTTYEYLARAKERKWA